MNDKYIDEEWEDFFKYAESNIVGYKRPADYANRVKRVLNGETKRAPMRLAQEGRHHESD